METIAKGAVVASLALGAGCAHIPDATVRYYLAETQLSLKVIRTLACDPLENIVIVDSISSTSTSAADPQGLREISLAPLKGTFSDGDIKFEFYEDGRLKAVNATTEGKGEEIIKTAIGIIGGVATMGKRITKSGVPPVKPCEYIKSAGDAKVLSLTYQGNLVHATVGQILNPDGKSAVHTDVLEPFIGRVCADVSDPKPSPLPVVAKHHDFVIKARQPGTVQVKVSGDMKCDREIWKGRVASSQAGQEYDLPVPKASVFGKSTFAAKFKESGALEELQYTSATGTGQALNVVDAALGEIRGLAAKRAQALTDEANLVAAQQRLTKCKATGDC